MAQRTARERSSHGAGPAGTIDGAELGRKRPISHDSRLGAGTRLPVPETITLDYLASSNLEAREGFAVTEVAGLARYAITKRLPFEVAGRFRDRPIFIDEVERAAIPENWLSSLTNRSYARASVGYAPGMWTVGRLGAAIEL